MAVYDAFVSYSHAKDKPIAAALQSVIQRLGKPWYRRRALRVFRDDTSLSATPSLWPSIEQALGNSRFLVLLASPEAAASPWVNKEVAWWLDHRSADTLLIALTDGELSWDDTVGDFAASARMPLPPVLAGRFATEPKWVDLRSYREGANPRDAGFIEAGADFAAAIRGMPKEDLLSQEVRQQRRALRLAWSAVAVVLLLLLGVGILWLEGDRARRLAQIQRDRAEQNFRIAKNSANALVGEIPFALRSFTGRMPRDPKVAAEVRGRTYRILSQARVMMEILINAAPDDLELQRSRNVMLREFATTYLQADDIANARASAEAALVFARALATRTTPGRIKAPSDGIRQSDVAQTLSVLGQIREREQDPEGARAAYAEMVEIWRARLASEDFVTSRLILAQGLYQFSNVSDPREARALLTEALTVLMAMSKGKGAPQPGLALMKAVQSRLDKLRTAVDGGGDKRGQQGGAADNPISPR
jgi:hypothetical protein